MVAESEPVAILLVLLVLAIAAGTGAGIWFWSPSLEEFRDLVIVIYGGVGILLLLALLLLVVVLILAVRGLTNTVRDLLDDPIKPTLHEVRQTAQNVRGSTEFVTDTAVHPVIRLVAMGRGVKRGVGVLTGLRKR